jgi:hypothetical protein
MTLANKCSALSLCGGPCRFLTPRELGPRVRRHRLLFAGGNSPYLLCRRRPLGRGPPGGPETGRHAPPPVRPEDPYRRIIHLWWGVAACLTRGSLPEWGTLSRHGSASLEGKHIGSEKHRSTDKPREDHDAMEPIGWMLPGADQHAMRCKEKTRRGSLCRKPSSAGWI